MSISNPESRAQIQVLHPGTQMGSIYCCFSFTLYETINYTNCIPELWLKESDLFVLQIDEHCMTREIVDQCHTHSERWYWQTWFPPFGCPRVHHRRRWRWRNISDGSRSPMAKSGRCDQCYQFWTWRYYLAHRFISDHVPSPDVSI